MSEKADGQFEKAVSDTKNNGGASASGAGGDISRNNKDVFEIPDDLLG